MKNVLPWQRVPSISFISPAPGPWKSCGPPQNSHKQTLKTQSPPTVADFIGSLIPSKPWSLLLVESLVIPILLLLICPQNFSRSVRAAECSTLDPPLPQWCLLHGGRFFHRHGHGSERISGECAVPGLGSNIENPGFFASGKKNIKNPIVYWILILIRFENHRKSPSLDKPT